jgi:glutaredoxin 3
LLDNLKVDYAVVELDKMSDGAVLQDALEDLTGQRTVPHNFINKKLIGGNSDLQDLSRRGKLEPLLREVGAFKEA